MLTRQEFVLSRLPKPILKRKGPGVNGVADVLEDEDSVACSFRKVNWWKATTANVSYARLAACSFFSRTVRLWNVVSSYQHGFETISTFLLVFNKWVAVPANCFCPSFQGLKSFDFVFHLMKRMIKRWKIHWSERNHISMWPFEVTPPTQTVGQFTTICFVMKQLRPKEKLHLIWSATKTSATDLYKV